MYRFVVVVSTFSAVLVPFTKSLIGTPPLTPIENGCEKAVITPAKSKIRFLMLFPTARVEPSFLAGKPRALEISLSKKTNVLVENAFRKSAYLLLGALEQDPVVGVEVDRLPAVLAELVEFLNLAARSYKSGRDDLIFP